MLKPLGIAFSILSMSIKVLEELEEKNQQKPEERKYLLLLLSFSFQLVFEMKLSENVSWSFYEKLV